MLTVLPRVTNTSVPPLTAEDTNVTVVTVKVPVDDDVHGTFTVLVSAEESAKAGHDTPALSNAMVIMLPAGAEPPTVIVNGLETSTADAGGTTEVTSGSCSRFKVFQRWWSAAGPP